MPEISRFFGMVVAMYYQEHHPPHFHVRYGKYKISIAIEDLRVLAGKLPPKALALVVEWASQHKNELIKDWELARQWKGLNPIQPLE